MVTGANKGIGYFIGLQLAQTGLFSNVILGCRDENRGKAAVNSMVQSLNESKCQCEVSYEPLTIGDIDSHKAFVQHMKEKFDKVDVLVNNAGIAFKNADPTPFKDQCKPTLGINFHGTVDFTERMFPLVRKGADARIVNVASMAGRLKQIQSKELRDRFKDPSLTAQELKDLVHNFETDVLDGTHFEKGWGRSNYSFSKLALIAMTKVWAREEAGNGIKINSCCPGYCDTDMTSHHGTRSPEEGAKNAVLPATMSQCPTGEYFSDFEVSTWGEC